MLDFRKSHLRSLILMSTAASLELMCSQVHASDVQAKGWASAFAEAANRQASAGASAQGQAQSHTGLSGKHMPTTPNMGDMSKDMAEKSRQSVQGSARAGLQVMGSVVERVQSGAQKASGEARSLGGDAIQSVQGVVQFEKSAHISGEMDKGAVKLDAQAAASARVDANRVDVSFARDRVEQVLRPERVERITGLVQRIDLPVRVIR